MLRAHRTITIHFCWSNRSKPEGFMAHFNSIVTDHINPDDDIKLIQLHHAKSISNLVQHSEASSWITGRHPRLGAHAPHQVHKEHLTVPYHSPVSPHHQVRELMVGRVHWKILAISRPVTLLRTLETTFLLE